MLTFFRFALTAFFVLSAGLPSITLGAAEPVRIQLGGEPSTLDPHRLVDQYGIGISANVNEGLFKLDQQGRLQNALAESYTVSKDGKLWRFKLRPEAKWSDGVPVRLEDFVTGLRHAMNPKTGVTSADYFFSIKNARKIFESKAPVESLGVSRDKEELVIELEVADPGLPYELSLPAAVPVREDVLKATKGVWSPKNPVTGDYTISIYKPSDTIELLPNPQRAGSSASRIQYRIFPEETTAMNLFEAGKLDIISTITLTEVGRYRGQGVLRTEPSTTVFYISFNCSRAPFNDPEWRQAITSVIDREGLAKVFQGTYEATTSYLPKSIEGTLPYQQPAFQASVAKIKALEKKPRLTIAFGASAFTKLVTEKLQFDLQQKLGVQINLEPMELKTLIARLKTDPPDMYLIGQSSIYNDPLNHLKGFSAVAAPNFSRFSSPTYEKLLVDIQAQPSGARRTELAREANRLLSEKEVVLAPLLTRQQVFGVSKKVTGFKVSPSQVIELKSLKKE